MKFLSNYRFVFAVVLCIGTLLWSCQKEKENASPAVTEEEATLYSSESLEADASYDDIQDISLMAAEEEGLESAGRTAGREQDGIRIYLFAQLRLRIGHCADITVSPDDGTYPRTVTIDFGNGCIGLDGKFRKGKIVLHYTGPIRQAGSVLTVTLVDFQLNRAKISGTKVISNLSENGNLIFSVQVTGGQVSFPNGRGYAYEALKYVRQTQGGATDELRDDIYTLEGRSQTTFNNGVKVILNTEDALTKALTCNWVSGGMLKIAVNNRAFLLDYSYPNNGDCDNKALLTWNTNLSQQVILLP